MKILHIVGNSRFGGSSLIILELARMAQLQGWQVEVLATDPTVQSILRSAGINVIPLEVVWREIRPWRDLWGLYRLYQFLKQARYTVVHTHTTKGGIIGRLAASLARTPVIVHTVHGFAFHEQSHPLEVRLCAWAERITGYCCHRIITVSEFHRQWALTLGIGDARKVVAIPNGIPESRLLITADPNTLRASLGASPEDLVILSTARLAPQKGLECLIRATRVAAPRLSKPVKIWLAGDGPLRGRLQNLATHLGVSDKIAFLGFRTDVGDLLAASDMVALPSLREGLSISLLEAMGAGKPVVTSSIGSNQEVTANGEAALLVPTDDVEKVAAAICRLGDDADLAKRLSDRARGIYQSFYTEKGMLARYADEYKRALNEAAADVKRPDAVPAGRETSARSHMHGAAQEPAGKRALDLIVCVPVLALLSPLMLLIALAIRLTSAGPALFRQRRLGRHGVPFTMYKFRTMYADAQDTRNPDGSAFNGEGDPRVTGLGRFLRMFSVDELPQLINVLKGEMSLVGPRPDQPDQLCFYEPEEWRKLEVRPGLTGLAQLSGRNSIPWRQRKQFDLAYVREQSLALDLRILLRTIPYVLRRKGVFGVPSQSIDAARLCRDPESGGQAVP